MRSLYVVLVVAAGCAQAGTLERGQPDASVRTSDSSVIATDAACTVQTKNLLANGNFDAGGAGWTVSPITSGDPLINTQAADAGPVGAQSPTYRAWMGGVVAGSGATVSDSMFQDVLIPASTTMLVFNGFFEIRSAEPDATIYDRATVDLTSPAGTAIEMIKMLDDNQKTTQWTPFTKTIAANVAGQTVRLKFSTTSDDSFATGFFFDTVSLDATGCQ